MLKWANKKQNNFSILQCCIFFNKQIKKNTCRYHYQNLDDTIYSSWDIEQNILKLVILGHFLPFYPPKKPQNQNFEKWKILLEISSFYRRVPKITIIWCTAPKIQSETDRIFCHFGPFFAFLTPPTPPLMILKMKSLRKKMKKMSGDVILLYIHVYHKWRS